MGRAAEALELCLLPHYVIRLGVGESGCSSRSLLQKYLYDWLQQQLLLWRVSSRSRVLWGCLAIDQTAEQYVILVGGGQ